MKTYAYSPSAAVRDHSRRFQVWATKMVAYVAARNSVPQPPIVVTHGDVLDFLASHPPAPVPSAVDCRGCGQFIRTENAVRGLGGGENSVFCSKSCRKDWAE